MASQNSAVCHDNGILDVVSGIVMTCFLVATLSVSYTFVKRYQHDKNSNKSHVSMRKSMIVTSTILVVSGVLLMIQSIVYFITCLLDIRYNRTFANAFIGIFWMFHCVCIMSIFLTRLHDVFNGTIYAYSKKTFISLIGLCIISGILAIVAMLILSIFTSLVGLFFAAIALFIYIFVSIATLGLFVYGLYKVKLYSTV